MSESDPQPSPNVTNIQAGRDVEFEIHGDFVGGGKTEIHGDQVGRDKISVGDLSGSYNAIGAGAQVIVTNIRQALSAVAELEKNTQIAERRLGDEIAHKIQQYTQLRVPTAVAERRNPYKALLDYKIEDAPYFYGRNEAIQTVWRKIHNGRLTILHSESGSGKTSLMQAGIAARLLAEGDFPLYLRPYRQPPAQSIKKAFLADYATQPELRYFRDDKMSLKGFLERVTSYLGGQRLYIFLDQFEEFFVEQSAETQQQFAQQLQECVESNLPVRWLLALRKEYFSDLRLFRTLRPFDNEYFLPTFRPAEATEVVVEPAARQQVAYEQGLVEEILVDIGQGQEGISPAHLQLVCFTLFAELGEGNQISRTLYAKRRGRGQGEVGAKGILTSHLTRVLDGELSGRERQVANRVLEALVSAEVRRVVRTEQEIAAEVKEATLLPAILATLTDNRLVRRERDENDHPTYELTHDYLLSQIELNPETQTRKAAQELLRQEIVAYQRFGTLLSRERFEIIHSQAAQLVLDETAEALLTRSEMALNTAQQQELAQIRTLATTRQRVNALLMTLVAFLVVALVISLQRPLRNELMRREAMRLGPMEPILASPNYKLGTEGESIQSGELPLQFLDIPPFQMDVYEVSVVRYRLCVTSGICSLPDMDLEQTYQASPDLPVTMVNVLQAEQFCQWLGRRLPTEVEWERAARGANSDQWPWSWQFPDTVPASVANLDEDSLMAVDSLADGRTKEGIYHMASNVVEWTRSYSNTPQYYLDTEQWTGSFADLEQFLVVRGGDYHYEIPITYRARNSWVNRADDTGFRCVAN